jgi:hypothetical protein
LSKLRNIAMLRQACKDHKSLEDLVSTNGYHRMKTLKMAGFSDKQVSCCLWRAGDRTRMDRLKN